MRKKIAPIYFSQFSVSNLFDFSEENQKSQQTVKFKRWTSQIFPMGGGGGEEFES